MSDVEPGVNADRQKDADTQERIHASEKDETRATAVGGSTDSVLPGDEMEENGRRVFAKAPLGAVQCDYRQPRNQRRNLRLLVGCSGRRSHQSTRRRAFGGGVQGENIGTAPQTS